MSFFLLSNTVQRYDWGSTTRIPELLGTAPDGSPAAELWLGGHPSAPSWVLRDGRAATSLLDLIRSDPGSMLGDRVVESFGPRLPYLLKVLAAERALSLQVHPSPHQARAGFNRENLRGLPPGSPGRSFHDDQHKPEMVVALSQFEGLAGFRTPRTVLSLLEGLEGGLIASVRDVLARDRSSRGMREAFTRLVAARHDPSCSSDIATTVASVRRRLADGSPFDRADSTVVLLSEQHPGDPGALASLMLNRVTLEPGESVFIPAGQVHAYLSGLAVEVMASSDNVLRAGLTSKLVDEEALVECATFEPGPPAVPEVAASGTRGHVHSYRAPVDEFALCLADVGEDGAVSLPDDGPRIVLCLDGTVTLRADGTAELGQGMSAFVPHAVGPVRVEGQGHVVCAWVP